MHRCLRITEILCVIARELGETERERGKNLLSMALTCRAFFDPAMDLLWEKINKPEVFFLCLPHYVRGDDEDLYTIIKSPRPAEWQRFELYARRVKELEQTYEEFTSPDLDKEIFCFAIDSWKSLRKYYPGSTPFPHLRSFSCSFDDSIGKLYEFIIPSTLQSFTIDSNDSKIVERACDATGICKESLKHLAINVLYCPSYALERIVQTTMDLPSLQGLRFWELLPESLPDLASIPGLETLSTRLQKAHPYVRGVDGNHTFTALKDLSLMPSTKDTGFSPFLSFFGVCNFRNLTNLTLRYGGHGECTPEKAQDTTSELLAAVSKLDKLRSFKLKNYAVLDNDENVRLAFGFHVLSNILILRDLIELEMCHITFDLTSESVHAIARAWPRIRRLILGVFCVHTPPSYQPSVVPQDLRPFATYCPDLETLGLPLKFPASSDSLPVPDLPGPQVTNLRLRTLDCGDYPVNYSLGVAMFLASAFPNATLLKDDENIFRRKSNVQEMEKINAKIASIVKTGERSIV